MGNYITSTGFQARRQTDIKADLEQAFRRIYGNSVQLAPQSTNGQKIGVWSEGLADIWEMAEATYNSFDPNAVVGVVQDLLYALNHVSRLSGTPSTATITITGTPAYTVEAGFGVSTDAGLTFTTDEAVEIGGGGTIDAAVTCTVNGANEAAGGTITNIDVPVIDVYSVTNADPAIAGRDRETDAEFRFRRSQTTGINGLSLLESAYSDISNLENVRTARVYENSTDEIVDFLPPHTWQVVVSGGNNQEIGEAIYRNNPVGIASIGDVPVDVLSSVVPELEQRVYFQRPTGVEIEVKIITVKTAEYPGDGDEQIKEKLVNYAIDRFTIGVSVAVTRLYTPVNEVQGHKVTSIEARVKGAPTWEIDLVGIEKQEISEWSIGDITII